MKIMRTAMAIWLPLVILKQARIPMITRLIMVASRQLSRR
jgi:hypothetical protein